MSEVAPRLVRAAFLAGCGIPMSEIARQTTLSKELLKRVFDAAGIGSFDASGPLIVLKMHIGFAVEDIDSVGRARRMCREDIAASVLRIVFGGGADTINEILDRGEL